MPQLYLLRGSVSHQGCLVFGLEVAEVGPISLEVAAVGPISLDVAAVGPISLEVAAVGPVSPGFGQRLGWLAGVGGFGWES